MKEIQKKVKKLAAMNAKRKELRLALNYKPTKFDQSILDGYKEISPDHYRDLVDIWNIASDFYNEVLETIQSKEMNQIAKYAREYFEYNKRNIPDFWSRFDRILDAGDLDEALNDLGINKNGFMDDIKHDPDNAIVIFDTKCDDREEAITLRANDLASPTKNSLAKYQKEYENAPEDFMNDLRIRFRLLRDVNPGDIPELDAILEVEDKIEAQAKFSEELVRVNKFRVLGILSIIRGYGKQYGELGKTLEDKEEEIGKAIEKLDDDKLKAEDDLKVAEEALKLAKSTYNATLENSKILAMRIGQGRLSENAEEDNENDDYIDASQIKPNPSKIPDKKPDIDSSINSDSDNRWLFVRNVLIKDKRHDALIKIEPDKRGLHFAKKKVNNQALGTISDDYFKQIMDAKKAD